MQRPEPRLILQKLRDPIIFSPPVCRIEGRLTRVSPVLLCATLPGASLGEICRLPGGKLAQIVSIHGDEVSMSPYQEPVGVSSQMMVQLTGQRARVGVGEGMLGRVLDAMGKPLDNMGGVIPSKYYEIESFPPAPMERRIIHSPLETGVRAVDSLLTIGEGQRTGIFAPAGCGKSTLLGMLATRTDIDVVVIALVGERGREVKEFLERSLDQEIRSRCVTVVATSDRPPLERLNAASTATAIAEYYRDQGKRVLLLVDSLTRYARAVREIALVSGEPVLAGGYPPGLYTKLPRLLERAGMGKCGSITAFYTILTDGRNDALAEEVRSLLDGHIVLSRKLAESGHFPAIDISESLSRIMNSIVPTSHTDAASRLRSLLTLWQEVELLIRVGEYSPGQDPEVDQAVAARPVIRSFLCQRTDETASFQESVMKLLQICKVHAKATN